MTTRADTPTQSSGRLSTSIQTEKNGGRCLTLAIEGRLDSTTTADVWREVEEALNKTLPSRVVIEASKVDYCDGSGISLFLELIRRQRKSGGGMEIQGLAPEIQKTLDFFDPDEFEEPLQKKSRPANFTEEIGRETLKIWKDITVLIAFVGELCAALVHACLNPGQVRWKDVFHVAETTGVNALPIVVLISFLLGLIMAFQAAMPMRMFGAEIFVADLIALSMIRELGPLMTAIVLAGRSGSAFAAELGTMTVNEEIDALTTMGLDPVRFLVTPRVIAAVVMTPLLTVFADLVGVLGGSIVLLSLGYPFVTYINQVLAAVDHIDFLGGLFKSFVFGIMIAGTGCLRGLQTQTGASAVGESATRAVVSGIILIALVDGVFSVLFFYLGI